LWWSGFLGLPAWLGVVVSPLPSRGGLRVIFVISLLSAGVAGFATLGFLVPPFSFGVFVYLFL